MVVLFVPNLSQEGELRADFQHKKCEFKKMGGGTAVGSFSYICVVFFSVVVF